MSRSICFTEPNLSKIPKSNKMLEYQKVLSIEKDELLNAGLSENDYQALVDCVELGKTINNSLAIRLRIVLTRINTKPIKKQAKKDPAKKVQRKKKSKKVKNKPLADYSKEELIELVKKQQKALDSFDERKRKSKSDQKNNLNLLRNQISTLSEDITQNKKDLSDKDDTISNLEDQVTKLLKDKEDLELEAKTSANNTIDVKFKEKLESDKRSLSINLNKTREKLVAKESEVQYLTKENSSLVDENNLLREALLATQDKKETTLAKVNSSLFDVKVEDLSPGVISQLFNSINQRLNILEQDRIITSKAEQPKKEKESLPDLPKYAPAQEEDIDRLRKFVEDNKIDTSSTPLNASILNSIIHKPRVKYTSPKKQSNSLVKKLSKKFTPEEIEILQSQNIMIVAGGIHKNKGTIRSFEQFFDNIESVIDAGPTQTINAINNALENKNIDFIIIFNDSIGHNKWEGINNKKSFKIIVNTLLNKRKSRDELLKEILFRLDWKK